MTADEQVDAVLDPAGHLDETTIAALDAGAFADDEAGRLGRHVAACAACQAKLRAVRGVQARLAALPPPTMPDSVLARLRQTIHDEQVRRAGPGSGPNAGFPAPFAVPAPPAPAGPPQPPGVVDLAAARERRARRAKWVTGIAAAVVAIAAGVVIGVNYGGSSETAGDLAGEQPASTVTAPAVGAAPSNGDRGRDLPELSTQALTSDLAEIVAQAQVDVDGSAEGAMSNSALRSACTSALGVDETPLAVLHATVDGKDAYVFVFPTGTEHQADVYVVGDQCGLGHADELFHGTGRY